MKSRIVSQWWWAISCGNKQRYSDLKYSKGCWQPAQAYNDLQAVGPNSLRSSVLLDPQNGQATRRMVGPSGTRGPSVCRSGGAIP